MPDSTDSPDAIQVSGGALQPSQRDQLTRYLEIAQRTHKPLRMRIPITVYETERRGGRSYTEIREGAWSLALPSEGLTVEAVESLMQAVGKAVMAIATHGSHAVIEQLSGLDGQP